MKRRDILTGGIAAITAAVALPAFAVVPTSSTVFDVHTDLSGQISDWLIDFQLEHGYWPAHLNLTRAAYKYAARNNLIDYLPGADGKFMPTFFGVNIDVPGTQLSVALAKTEWPYQAFKPSGLKTGTPPLGTPIFDQSHDLVEHVIDWFSDQSFDGNEPSCIYFTRHAYAQAQRDNLIDFMPDEEGHHTIPTFLGRGVVIVI
jgi:hypothetical protein